MKKTKIVDRTKLFCNDCGDQLDECDSCHELFEKDKEVYCDSKEYNHYCEKCGKEKSKK